MKNNMYLQFIKDVGQGMTDKYLEEYLHPEVSGTAKFEKYKEIRKNNMLNRVEFTRRIK